MRASSGGDIWDDSTRDETRRYAQAWNERARSQTGTQAEGSRELANAARVSDIAEIYDIIVHSFMYTRNKKRRPIWTCIPDA